ncbi:MAG: type II secretion system protein [Patescibacteria group bacterium]
MKKGFTLIELLVVIAIIGILSSIVLASLNTARDKGADANIKSNLEGLRASAAAKYDDMGNTYNNTGTNIATDTCNGLATAGTILEQPSINLAIADAVLRSGGDATCQITAIEYAIAVPLKTDPAQFWCVDDTSKAVILAARPVSAVCQ